MRILYIANNSQNDFLSDAVFHGLKCLDNVEVVDYNPLWYMYNNIKQEELVNKFHGRGFTYYASLPYTEVDRTNIEEKIKQKYFDVVIYGNIHRNLDLKDLVFSNYNEDRIIALDGQDGTELNTDFVLNTIYFKRELTKQTSYNYPFIHPIHFAYPEDKIAVGILDKEKLMAQIIPGVSHTFTFNDETSYFEDHRKSLFGFTWKKSGWDCLRHYEIICNGCIPLFIDIEHCPDTMCTTLPKEILKDFYTDSGIYDLFDMKAEVTYDDRNAIITNRDLTLVNDIVIDDNFYKLYSAYLDILTKYAKQNLTTKVLAEYVLSFVI